MSKEAMKLALDEMRRLARLANIDHAENQGVAALERAITMAEQPAQGCNYCNHALYSGTKCKNCGRVTEQAAIKRDLTPEQPAQQDIPDLIAGTLGVSRGTAYDLMREALAQERSSDEQPAPVAKPHEQEPVNQRAHEMAQRQWDHWKQYALELQERLVKYEGGAPMVLNTTPPAAQPAPVPEGWKLVPVNPTPEMLAAADQGDREYTLRNFGDIQTVMQGPEDHYAAMLNAAPAAPVQPVALDITIDDDDALAYLRDMFVQSNGDLTPIRLLVGDGHSGHGLYVASADYPEEGAIKIADVAATPPAAQPAVPLTLWTEAQHERAYRNSPELHKDVKSLAAFKRVAKKVAAMYGITEKGQP